MRLQAEQDLLASYRLNERLFRARIPPGSFLINRSLGESMLREKFDLSLVAIENKGQTLSVPTSKTSWAGVDKPALPF
jgi:K+/H+ antiporter YhaU regulatory subunit KhtT